MAEKEKHKKFGLFRTKKDKDSKPLSEAAPSTEPQARGPSQTSTTNDSTYGSKPASSEDTSTRSKLAAEAGLTGRDAEKNLKEVQHPESNTKDIVDEDTGEVITSVTTTTTTTTTVVKGAAKKPGQPVTTVANDGDSGRRVNETETHVERKTTPPSDRNSNSTTFSYLPENRHFANPSLHDRAGNRASANLTSPISPLQHESYPHSNAYDYDDHPPVPSRSPFRHSNRNSAEIIDQLPPPPIWANHPSPPSPSRGQNFSYPGRRSPAPPPSIASPPQTVTPGNHATTFAGEQSTGPTQDVERVTGTGTGTGVRMGGPGKHPASTLANLKTAAAGLHVSYPTSVI